MRPTGRLHIGHYFGALQNWVRLQNERDAKGQPEYECFYFIADWHALTSDYADTSAIVENTLQIMIDYLAAGLDPQKSVIFQQSVIPEHAELHLLLSMVTPLGWLERVPTYKEALENVKDKDLHNYGFLGYPVLQTADIVIYGEPGTQLLVPVGEDQVSHVEISRKIVNLFNSVFGIEIDHDAVVATENLEEVIGLVRLLRPPSEVGFWESAPGNREAKELESRIRALRRQGGLENFLKTYPKYARYIGSYTHLQPPQAMLTQTPRIPGLDGRKMSKSYGNAITLSETDEEIRAKTKVMVTDPARKRRTDKGNPDVCPVYDWHKLFSTQPTLEWAAHGCRTAGIGCIECKAKMAEHLIEWIAPVRERRMKWERDPKGVLEILDEGSRKARKVAQGTMERVREAVFHWNDKKKEIEADAAGMS